MIPSTLPTSCSMLLIEFLSSGRPNRELRHSSPLLQTPFSEGHPASSPDGRWVAYQSDASGRHEIYVRPFPDVDAGRWQLSTSGGLQPTWGPEGKELFSWSDAGLISVPVDTENGFTPGTPEVLCALDGYAYDATIVRSTAQQDDAPVRRHPPRALRRDRPRWRGRHGAGLAAH